MHRFPEVGDKIEIANVQSVVISTYTGFMNVYSFTTLPDVDVGIFREEMRINDKTQKLPKLTYYVEESIDRTEYPDVDLTEDVKLENIKFIAKYKVKKRRINEYVITE